MNSSGIDAGHKHNNVISHLIKLFHDLILVKQTLSCYLTDKKMRC